MKNYIFALLGLALCAGSVLAETDYVSRKDRRQLNRRMDVVELAIAGLAHQMPDIDQGVSTTNSPTFRSVTVTEELGVATALTATAPAEGWEASFPVLISNDNWLYNFQILRLDIGDLGGAGVFDVVVSATAPQGGGGISVRFGDTSQPIMNGPPSVLVPVLFAAGTYSNSGSLNYTSYGLEISGGGGGTIEFSEIAVYKDGVLIWEQDTSVFNEAAPASLQTALTAADPNDIPNLQTVEAVISSNAVVVEVDPIAMAVGFITGTPAEDVVPATNSTYDLGSSNSAWAEVHADSILVDEAPITSEVGGLFTQPRAADPEVVWYQFDDQTNFSNTIADPILETITWDAIEERYDFTASGSDFYIAPILEAGYPFVEGYTGSETVMIEVDVYISYAEDGSAGYSMTDQNAEEAGCDDPINGNGVLLEGSTTTLSFGPYTWPPEDCSDYFSWGSAGPEQLYLNIYDANAGEVEGWVANYRIFTPAVNYLDPEERILTSPTFVDGEYFSRIGDALAFISGNVTNVLDADVTTP